MAVPAAARRRRRRGDARAPGRRHPPPPRRRASRSWSGPGSGATGRSLSMRARSGPATASTSSVAIERMRFALGVDDDYRELYDAFRSDRLLGTAIRRKRWHRPRRRPWAWEALAWSITKQLIESSRAAEIQRRMVLRWGARHEGADGATLRDVPTPELIAGRAPAELAAMDLAPARALAMIRAAREVAAGRVDPGRPRRRPPPARDPGDRPLDDPVPGPLRPRRARLAAGRRPRLHQAGRPPRRPRPPRDRRGGGGVLRPLCAVPRPRRRVRPRRAPPGGRHGPAAALAA